MTIGKHIDKSVLCAICLLILISLSSVIFNGSANAVTASDWRAGRIIDDAVFYNKNSMTVQQIQQFLAAKVPVCDRNRASSNPSYQPPWTCLKEYQENTITKENNIGRFNANGTPYNVPGGKGAAQIIWDVAQEYGINPQVLIVMLQKEQGLVTDNWPWKVQYQKAMGYACPDTAPCDAQYYGFYNQVSSAAWQLKRYIAYPNSYNFKAGVTRFIQYSPNAACGGSQVFIENPATAALYNYTPYQPNAGALMNMYGTADCGAYGNRNFWRYFNDWFGSTINDAYLWKVIKEPGVNKLYLQVNNTRYLIPGPDIYSAWGLDKYTYQEVQQSYFNSLAIGPNLNYVALDINGNRFLMANGKKHYLANDSYVLAWGLAGVPHVSAPGYIYVVESGGNAAKFATTDGLSIYMVNGYTKHALADNDALQAWGYANNATKVSQGLIDRLTTGILLDRYIDIHGAKYIADNGQLLKPFNQFYTHAWGSKPYASLPHAYATNLIPKQNIGNFIIPSNDTKWYYIENGKRHYVSSTSLAEIWGWSTNNPLVKISPSLYDELTPAPNLSYVVSSNNDGRHYLINKTKHYIPNSNMLKLWFGDNNPVQSFSAESLELLSSSTDVNSSIVGFQNNPHIYALNNGSLIYIPSQNTLNALGADRNNRIFTATNALGNMIQKSGKVDVVIKDSLNNVYYLQNGYKHKINSTFSSSWVNANTPLVSDSLLSSLTDSLDVTVYVKKGSKLYIINNRTAIDVTSDYSNYGVGQQDFVYIDKLYFPAQASSHLVGTSTSNKIWLLSQAKRYHIQTYGLLLDLGYGSHSTIAQLNQAIIDNLPEQSSPANNIIRGNTTGSIFAVNGKGFGFKNSLDIKNYLGSTQSLVVPDSIFNKYSFHGWVSPIIYGTSGKVYKMEDGTKRWITSQVYLNNNYSSISWFQVPQHTIEYLKTGTNIN